MALTWRSELLSLFNAAGCLYLKHTGRWQSARRKRQNHLLLRRFDCACFQAIIDDTHVETVA